MRIAHTDTDKHDYSSADRDLYVGTYGNLYSTSYGNVDALAIRYIFVALPDSYERLCSTNSNAYTCCTYGYTD